MTRAVVNMQDLTPVICCDVNTARQLSFAGRVFVSGGFVWVVSLC